MSNGTERMVNQALDEYLRRMRRRGVEPDGVRAATLAEVAGVTREAMSNALQRYRVLQGRRQTRYVVAAHHYGRAGRWTILAKPGVDSDVLQRARAEATAWAQADMARRWLSDAVNELIPGLRNRTRRDAIIERLIGLAEIQVEVVRQHVARELEREGLL